MHTRSLLAVALAALLATPAAASAQAKRATTTTSPAPSTAPVPGALAFGGWLGYESGDLDGIQLRVDGEMPFQRLTPQVDLSFVGSVGFSHRTDSVSVFGLETKSTQNLLKLVPAARFTIPLNSQLSLFGDAGLGLYYSSVTVKTTEPFFGTVTEVDDSAVGLMLRLGAGGFFAVNPRTKLGVQLVLDPMFGDHDDTSFSVLAGLAFQL